MAKLTFFIIIIFLAILGLLAFHNKDTVDLTVWEGMSYQMPIIALILLSSAAGILSMLIIVFIRDSRRFFEGRRILRQQKKEKKIDELYSKGQNAYYASKYGEASDLFNNVIEEVPSHFEALVRLGDISFQREEYIKAKEYYLRAADIKPRNVEVLLALKELFETQGKWQEAIKQLDSVLEIDEENLEILYQKRELLREHNKWDDVIDLQQKILKSKVPEEEEENENRNLLGYKYEQAAHLIETGSTDKAIKALKSILKTDESFTAAYSALTDAYIKEGNSSEAENTLMRGYELTSAQVLLVRLEEFFISMGEPGSIIELYQKAIQKDPGNQELKFFLAKLYYRLEMVDHALDTINTIDTTSFDYPDLHILRANIYERRAQHEEAVEEYKKAMSIDEEPLVVPFCCSVCNYSSENWSGRCPACNNWNSFILDVNEVCKKEKRQIST